MTDDDLADLYHDIILDHSKAPHNMRAIVGTHHYAEGFNPLCGDHIKVFLTLTNDHVDDAAFTGQGCAICTASASMMTDAVKGQPKEDTLKMFEMFHSLLIGSRDPDEHEQETLGLLAALCGVRRFPIRVKCATLPWHALKAALVNPGEAVSTE